MIKKTISFSAIAIFLFISAPIWAQHSVARKWNDALLYAIEHDLARPPVHARNLFHCSVVMYDAWAAYDDVAETYLLGKTINGYHTPFDSVDAPANITAAREEAISHAAYRLLRHRFQKSPGATGTLALFDSLLAALGFNAANTSTNYANGSPAALGNYIAEQMIAFGLQDGSNEQGNYAYQHYRPFNPPLAPFFPGNPDCVDPNRWQPLHLRVFIDQSGHVIPGDTTRFQMPEWGLVSPFSLTDDDLTIYERDGDEYWVYHDPGSPPLLDTTAVGGISEEYKWTFSLVSIWQSHLDPSDGVMWDISPGAIGNITELPQTVEEHRNFYNLIDGGDTGRGHAVNPHTGQSYAPQVVPRGDYTRVLAEFWADGPNSETPPGHWFSILNHAVNDHPVFEKRFKGEGAILDDLEWDVKAYFTLGGAMHDAAITAWGIKGWYDYVRPISAIRYMADRGQSTDPNLPSYSPAGIPLVPGFIELVMPGDPLAEDNTQALFKIKLYTWRGHYYIPDTETDVAGVDWILADDWFPYQRPTFVTPPFAGYISGHSTYSRTAAEVLTLLTGDPFFPGGLGEFHCTKNEFLVFEDGPRVDITLQWATYRDASDQTSLSRIWGGIHPPVDDIPGRIIGQKLGPGAVAFAERYFNGQVINDNPPGLVPTTFVYPNPVRSGAVLNIGIDQPAQNLVVQLYNIRGQLVQSRGVSIRNSQRLASMNLSSVVSGVYLLRINGGSWVSSHKILILR
jgi:hypothetical protein